MNLRYHKFDLDNTYEKGRCLSIISSEPERRSIYCLKDSTTLRPYIATVWYPYYTFVVQYYRKPGGFLYYGQPMMSLRLFFHNKPLTSLSDTMFYSPTECGDSVVCTDHDWDGAIFKKPNTLLGTVLDLYWSMPHYVLFPIHGIHGSHGGAKEWSDLKEENVLLKNWDGHGYSLGDLMRIPSTEKLIDAPITRFPSLLSKYEELEMKIDRSIPI